MYTTKSLMSFFHSYKKYLVVGAIGLGLVGVSYFLYVFYRLNREAQAHRVFAESLQYYRAPVHPDKKEQERMSPFEKVFSSTGDKWKAVDRIFQESYESYNNSSLSPFFLLYQAEAQKNMGDLSRSSFLIEKALEDLPVGDLAVAFRIKAALMNIDQGLVQEGLSVLERLAVDNTHSLHDFTLYFLGEYFWAKKDYEKVKNYWSMLLLKYGKGSEYPSPWALKIKPRLKLIS